MKSSLSPEHLCEYVNCHLDNFIPQISGRHLAMSVTEITRAMTKTLNSFAHLDGRYYDVAQQYMFNHLNANHYTVFLAYLANVCYFENIDEMKAERVFLLNRYLNNVDFFYKVKFPDIFEAVHPLGSILGSAEYSGKVVVYQGVTVGSVDSGVYPVFEGDVILYSNCKILGDCRIGKNVVFAANSFILNLDIPGESTVVGQFPNHRIIKK